MGERGKILMKAIKEVERETSMLMDKNTIVKMAALSNLNYRFNAVLV